MVNKFKQKSKEINAQYAQLFNYFSMRNLNDRPKYIQKLFVNLVYRL